MDKFTAEGPNGKERTFNLADMKNSICYAFLKVGQLETVITHLLQIGRIEVNDQLTGTTNRIRNGYVEYDYIVPSADVVIEKSKSRFYNVY